MTSDFRLGAVSGSAVGLRSDLKSGISEDLQIGKVNKNKQVHMNC